MKFGNLILENFLAFEEATVNLADRGLLLIEGVNEDESSAESNGAGKSSIADALCWCLYGTTARGEEGDRVVNRFVGKGCRVVVTIEDGDDGYRISRHRKHKTGKNTLRVEKWDPIFHVDNDLTKGTDKLTQELVNQILGCSYDVFRAAIYAAQNEMPDLPGMTDKQLKLMVEEAAGITLLEAAYEDARTRLAGAKAKSDNLAIAHAREDQTLTIAVDQFRDAQAERDAYEVQRAISVNNLVADAKLLAGESRQLSAHLVTLDEPGTEAKIDVCDRKIASLATEQMEEKRLEGEVNTALLLVARLEHEKDRLTNEAKRLKDGIASLDHQVGCPCGSCRRPFTTSDIEPAKDAEREKLREKLHELNDAKTRSEYAQKSIENVTQTLSTFRASMTDVSAISAQRALLASQMAQIHRVRVDRDQTTQKARDSAERAKTAKVAPNPHLNAIERAQDRIDTIGDTILQLEADKAEADQLVALHEVVVKVFGPAGARAYLLDDVTPFLNDQTAKYLGTLSDGNISATWATLVKNAKGELKEKFSIEVTTVTGGETFKGISGGEKRKVQVAAALALQDLVARRATKPIDLFIGDEIDHALDNPGLERLTTILEEKARERGTVLVISHRDLKSWITNAIIVTKKDKKSTLREAVL